MADIDVKAKGIRGVTLAVAASNSSAKSKASADYICDGQADDVQIQAAIDALSGGDVYLFEGTYSTSAKITVSSDVHLHLSNGSKIAPASNIDVVEVQVRARLSGGEIDVSGLGAGGFTNSAILIDGTQYFGVNLAKMQKNPLVSDIKISGFESGTTFGGNAIYLDCTANDDDILFTVFRDIVIRGRFEYGIKATLTTGFSADLSANVFDGFIISGVKNYVYSSGAGNFDGNRFDNFIIEGEGLSGITGFTIVGDNNIIHASLWDYGSNTMLNFTSATQGNKAVLAFAGGNNVVLDEGSNNEITFQSDSATSSGLAKRNLLKNGRFELWDNASGLPKYWLKNKFTVERETTIVSGGTYSAKCTCGGDYNTLQQVVSDWTKYKGKAVILIAKVRAESTNDKDQVFRIVDGPTATNSAVLARDDTWHIVRVTHTVSASATELSAYLYGTVPASTSDVDDVIYVQWMMLVEGSAPLLYQDMPITSETLPQYMPSKYKQTDETLNNDTTFQDDDDLQFPVEIYDKYEFSGMIFFNSSAVADIKLQWSLPTGGVVKMAYHDSISPLAAGAPFTIDTGGSKAFDGAGADRGILFWGVYIGGGGAGSVKLQWAQNTAEVSDTKVLAGSYLISRRIQ